MKKLNESAAIGNFIKKLVSKFNLFGKSKQEQIAEIWPKVKDFSEMLVDKYNMEPEDAMAEIAEALSRYLKTDIDAEDIYDYLDSLDDADMLESNQLNESGIGKFIKNLVSKFNLFGKSKQEQIAEIWPQVKDFRAMLVDKYNMEPEDAMDEIAEALSRYLKTDIDAEDIYDYLDSIDDADMLESAELARMKELAGISEGFDPEHFDAKAVSIKVKNERGHDIDCIVSYTATLIDGVPTIHPRSIVARPMTDKWGDREKYMTKMVVQDQEALAAIQKHAEEIWSERDNDYKSGDVLGSKYADKIAKVARGEFSTGDPNEYDGSGVTAGRHEKF